MDGILLVDKPRGMTSHDVVDFIRKKFGFKKVGHAGTLDPLATGLLVILIGNATKKSEHLRGEDKAYTTTVKPGVTTDTGDRYGKVLDEKDCDINPEKITKVLNRFMGEIEQVPPMFSAKKHKGKRLYEYARKGIEIERKARKVTIKKLELIHFGKSEFSLEIKCSKGTYIRQLACDIGEALGCGAHITGLRRTRSGSFNVDDSIKIDDLNKGSIDNIHENIIRI
ncbi:MAG: tRNA pseudouridine(55) synthase TruB [Candidatus Omnitrophica bacterium]|nr:tRNA pseudouridine(55) synthase TruB [Candidatus Omnitrophota bacterium]